MTSQSERGPTQRLRHRERSNNRRGAQAALPVTRGDIQHVGGDQVGWWHPVGTNADVRALRGHTSEKTVPGEVRMSSYQGFGVSQYHPPYNDGDSVASITLASNRATGQMLFDSDYIRVSGGSVEGGCGLALGDSIAGATYTQVVTLQPSLVFIPTDVALTNVVSFNCTAAATNIGAQRFSLDITSTAGGAFAYAADFKTIAGDQPPPGGGGGGGGGPIFGLDNSNHSVESQFVGEDFIIIKATQGTSFVSSNLHENFNNAVAAGVEYGFYHFGDTHGTGAAQWAHFISVVSGLGVDPTKHCLSLDWEITGGMSFPNGQQWISTGQGAGYKVGVYASEGRPYPNWGQDWRWVAHWGVPHPGIPYDVHQYGFVNRGGQTFDADRAPVSLATLNAKWHA